MTSVAAIESMDREALLLLWSDLMGSTPPRSMSQPLLRRVLAWEVQAKAHGALPATIRTKIDGLRAAQAKGAATKASSNRLKPGGRLLREWNGVTHVVDAVEGGFLWRGERHRSLSAIAQAITGAHWSGPRFFGLQELDAKTKRAGSAKAAAKPKLMAQPFAAARSPKVRRTA